MTSNERVAAVTGSTSGIGFATARVLAEQGHRTVVNARHQADVQDAIRQLSESGARVVGYVGDVSDPAVAAGLIAHAQESSGGIDVLVNNAARSCVVDALDLDEAEWNNVLAVNLGGPMWTAQAAARVMTERGGGVIVNVASVMGITANAHREACVASKKGLVGLTQALAVEWGPSGIRTCAVSPSFIETRMVRKTMGAGKLAVDGIKSRTPLRRMGAVDKVAHVITFLCSDGASFVNGANIPVDGGWLVNADI